MSIFLSPGVITKEQDATLFTREKSNKVAAIAGAFQWGPVDEPTFVSGGEEDFVGKFFPPNDATAKYGMIAIDFLSYSKAIWVVRQTGSGARNAFPVGQTAELIRNDSEFLTANLAGTDFIGRFPGSIGNGITVDIADGVKFDTWEHKNAFTYKPHAGEFAVAVVDTSGVLTGEGSKKQKERLIVSGNVVGGVKQKQTITVTGSATGGVKQEETLTFLGTASGTSLTVNGTAVVLVAGDTASVVAGKVAAALAALPAYQSAVATSNTVHVVFAAPATQAKIVDGLESGIAFSSVVTEAGNPLFSLPVYDEVVTVTFGDTASVVAGKIAQVFAGKVAKYESVTQPTGTKVQYTFVAYGPKNSTASVTLNGLTLATLVDIAGDADVLLSVFGNDVLVANGDTPAIVASKIAADTAFADAWETVEAFSSYVLYTSKVAGIKTKEVAPAAQFGVTFAIEVSDPGRSGSVVEVFELLKNDATAKSVDGTTKFWYDAINRSSKYVRACDKDIPLSARSTTLAGGVDDHDINVAEGFQMFESKEAYDIQFLISPDVPVEEQKAIVDVAETRLDCMAFVAPALADVVNNKGNEMSAVNDWRVNRLNKDSTYAFGVDNWGYMYDKYNDVYRWVPATGGTAGLAARTFMENDPWISFAGHQRGRYKNYVRMAWSSKEADRNELYKTGINSIVTFPGEGIVLYGDKTLTSRPSAFGHVNVRWAFIVSKVSLADMAKYFLFELNTPFTRAQFVNAARPFLRNMKSRNAFEDFKLVCDDNNNGGEVRSQNRMVAQVMIKPLYSINWVVLNLTAVRPDVSFEEVELQG